AWDAVKALPSRPATVAGRRDALRPMCKSPEHRIFNDEPPRPGALHFFPRLGRQLLHGLVRLYGQWTIMTGQESRPGPPALWAPAWVESSSMEPPGDQCPRGLSAPGAPLPRAQMVQGQLMVQGKSKYSSSPMISARWTRISRL